MKLFKYILLLTFVSLYSCTTEDPVVEPDPVNISISDVSVIEGNEYSKAIVLLTLDSTAASQITANISTVNGTAESGQDYVSLDNSQVVFAAGEVEKSLEIDIIGDLIEENNESFEITISSVTGPAVIVDGTATVTLENDDVAGMKTIELETVVDWDELKNLEVGMEVPYGIMNFGQPANIPNAEYTTVGTVGDTLLIPPMMSPAGDTILYVNVPFQSGGGEFFEAYGLDAFSTPDLPYEISSLAWVIIPIGQDSFDVELKYGIEFYLGTDQGRIGPFTIDPKMRVPN